MSAVIALSSNKQFFTLLPPPCKTIYANLCYRSSLGIENSMLDFRYELRVPSAYFEYLTSITTQV